MANTELDAPQDDTNAPQAAPKKQLFEWIGGYFKGSIKPDRFDGFGVSNDGSRSYFNRLINPKSKITRACVTVEAVAFHEIAQDADMIYVPCGISSGLRMHELLDRKNRSRATGNREWDESTYKSDERLAGTLVKHAIEQNKDDNLRRAAIVSRMYADKMVVAPVVREGAVRALSDRGFAKGQRYEEEDFMAFWYPVIDRCKMMVLDGDWNFSRNSIWEMMRGVLIQAGQLESRPDADMDVRDLEGKPVSLLWRTEKLAEMLKYQLGKGFEPREAATALAQVFTLDDEIRAGKIPAEGRKLHPTLQNRSPEELAAMDALKAELLPILKNQCASLMRLDDLPEGYRIAAQAKPRKLSAKLLDACKQVADRISANAYSILSVLPSDSLRAKHADIEARPQRVFDSYERFFEKRAQSKMFEDDVYGKLQKWERLALPFAIGASETGLYPTGHPMATMVFADLKRGKYGAERADAMGVDNMDELAGALGRETAEIISANLREAETLQAEIKAKNPHKIVVSTPSFLRIASTIERMRPEGFIAEPGAGKTSPQLRLALQMKYLDRNVDKAVFQEGWQRSNDLVQLRVRARLIQAGMIERPTGAQSTLDVFSAADLKTPETLLTDIQLLTQEVRRAALSNVVATEQAVALARLVALHDMGVDPSARNAGEQTRDPINTNFAPPELVSYDRGQTTSAPRESGEETVVEEARRLLTTKAALWIPHDRLYAKPDTSDDGDRASVKAVQNKLMDAYLSAQTTLRGEQKLIKQSPARDDVEIRRDGAGR
ncbi:MAG: hypothetical protein ACKVOE_01760 [Rickettsiales bacterium]